MPRRCPPLPDIDIADNTSTIARLAIGASYSGRLEVPGDVDWIAVELVARQTYTFNLGPGTSNAGAEIPLDTTLGIHDATGTLVAFNDDLGWTGIVNPRIGGNALPYNNYSFIEFTPTVSGTYYLAASTLTGSGQTGDYVLSSFVGDLPADNSTSAELQVGGANLASTLEASGDIDSFRVETVAGEYYTVLVTAIASPLSIAVPSLEVRDANGNVLAGQPNFYDYITQVTFQATSTTTYLDVASFIPGLDVGPYSIHVEEASLTDVIEANWAPLPASNTVYFIPGGAEVTNAFGETEVALAWSEAEMNAALDIFRRYSDVANVTFTVVDDPALANIVMSNRTVVAPGDVELAGRFLSTGTTLIDGVAYTTSMIEMYLDFVGMADGNFAPGSYAYSVLSHELGHALGLSHPHDGFGNATHPGIQWNYETGDFALGQGIYTQMSYNSGFSEKDGFRQPLVVGGQPAFGADASPMAVDIAALQQIYGANTATGTGDDTYILPEENAPGTSYVAIWDNGGIDTIRAAATNTSGVTIDLRPATLDYDDLGGGTVSWARSVAGGFTIAHGVVIEQGIGAAGNDRLVGNEAANLLEGQAGDDELGGGAGNDRLYGGTGNDRLFGDVLPGKPSGIGFGSGLIEIPAGNGNDTVATALDITNAFALFNDPDIANPQTVPHVTISGIGDDSFDVYQITLAKGASMTLDIDQTTGGLDASLAIATDLNYLAILDDGRVQAGAGGSFSQLDPFGTFTAWDGGTYYIFVLNAASGGPVGLGQSYNLHVSVAMTTDAAGAGAGNDYLDGGRGDDFLDGGFGRDKMIGGAGNDVFVVDNLRDVVVEGRNDGHDRIQSSVSLDLDSFAEHVEDLTLTGSADLSGSGNGHDNAITGNDGENRLRGKSGDDRLEGAGGNDRLEGGAGDDWLNGGLGRDRLEGGSGDDQFYFGDWLGAGNVDTIIDFDRRDDLILLDNDVFLGLSLGSLANSAFKTLNWGSSVDSSDRILYNARSGDLFFDQDGSGMAYDPIRFANVANGANLSASDFLVV